MEERKLNFSAPLLSVRQFSASKKRLENSELNRHQRHSSCNSDATLGQVTEPVAVPFHWEQIPGIPKDCVTLNLLASENASNSRRTEPRRFFDILKQRVDKKLGEKSTEMQHIEANLLDGSKEGLDREKAIDSESDDDDEDDLYSDALEAFSPGDSFSVNCSASGLSNIDGLVVEPSENYAAEWQGQNFMMSRFLPAAKAMALNPPHCASKKQPVVVEQPRQIIKVKPPVVVEQSRQIVKLVNMDRRSLLNKTDSSLFPVYCQDAEDNESENDCEEDISSRPAGTSTKACGLLPWLCIKNSLSILNPIPGMKMRSQSSISTGYQASKLSKITSSRSQSPTTKKRHVIAGSSKKPDNTSKSYRLLEHENKLKFGSNRFTSVSDRQTMSRTSSSFRRSAGTSPNRSRSPFKDMTGYVSSPKNIEHLKANRVRFYNKGGSKSQELLPHHVTKQWSCPMIPAIEKTLHVDTAKKTQNSHPGSGKDLRSLPQSREVHNVKCLTVPERKSSTTAKTTVSVQAHSYIEGDKSPPRNQGGVEEGLSAGECKALVCVGATIDGNVNKNAGRFLKEDIGNAKTSFALSAAPPALPKTPSESWLWRALPSHSSRNQFSDVYRRASFRSKEQDLKPFSADTKWESIVKSSYLHRDHLYYSEELICHASQQSRR